MQKAGQQLSDDLDMPAAPTGVPKDVEEHIKLMYDLQVLAWQAEITRVSTFLMCKELSAQSIRRAASATRSTRCRITRTSRRTRIASRC